MIPLSETRFISALWRPLEFYDMKAIIPFRTTLVVLTLFTFGLSLASGQTSNTCVSPLDAGGYSKFTIAEFAEYKQTNAAGAVPYGSNSFYFEAVVALATNLAATNATVTIPSSGPQTMNTNDDRHFSYIVATNNFTNLVSAFPDGEYEFIVSNITAQISLPEFTTLPNAPTLTSYTAAQSIDATKDFTLNWVPFSSGTTRDYIDVQLTGQSGTVFKSGQYLCPVSLDGTATSVLIPANTLETNQIYSAEIDFVKVLLLDTNSTPGIGLLAGTEAVTLTFVSTSTTAQIPPPVLGNAALLPGGGIQFDLVTTPGVTYTVQFSSDLSNPAAWSSLLVTDAVSTSVTFSNGPPAGTNTGFYRAFHN
jgi:hypothetical protein